MRIFLALLTCSLGLIACGFQPVHNTRVMDSAVALQEVAVEVPTSDRLGQLFRIALEDSMHPEGVMNAPRYRLRAQVEEIKQPIIIERDASITRYNLVLKATYELVDLRTGTSVAKHRTQRISSYNVSDSDFATYIAERNARQRGTKELAHAITRQLASLTREVGS